jgi:hypothetical protein
MMPEWNSYLGCWVVRLTLHCDPACSDRTDGKFWREGQPA